MACRTFARCAIVMLSLCAAGGVAFAQAPLAAAFTYQGRLQQNAAPFDGPANLVFRLYDEPSGGNLLGTQTHNGVAVAEGLFTVQLNGGGEFGPNAFDGAARWLEITVNGTPLAPRQPLTAAPYALYALNGPGGGLWTANGNHIHNANNGNVGVGTAAPQHALHVAGDLRGETRTALGNDAYLGLGGGVYPEYDRVHDFSHWITDFSSSLFWSPVLSTVLLDPAVDLIGADSTQIYGNSFETHIAATSDKDLDFVVALYGGAVHKGTGQATNLFGELLFGGIQGPGTVLYNFGLAVDAGGSHGATGSIINNMGISVMTGHWGVGGGVQTDTSLLVRTPLAFQPIDAHYGIYLENQNVAQTTNYAIYSAGGDVYFNGDLEVTGTLSKGGGSFKIDHPLDPANKYLYHSFVESPDMLNVYNGNAVTDERGYATVTMPEWFETLNRDFRYQLTVLDDADGDAFVQAKVARKLKDNRFTIRTSAPRVEVSWQITGVRQDPWAEAHRIPVEEDKRGRERGKYLHPELYGRPAEMGIHHRPSVEAAADAAQMPK